jgi:hypothetical protein
MRPKIISPWLILLAPMLFLGLTACGELRASDTAPDGPWANPQNGQRLEQMGAISALTTPTPYIQPTPTARITGTRTPLPPIEPTPIDLPPATVEVVVEATIAAIAPTTAAPPQHPSLRRQDPE